MNKITQKMNWILCRDYFKKCFVTSLFQMNIMGETVSVREKIIFETSCNAGVLRKHMESELHVI